MERLREHYNFSNQHYSRLNEQEIESLHIKPRLTESISYTLTDIMNASKVLREDLIQEKDKRLLDLILKQLQEKGINNSFAVWKLPIGRYGNENGNKRIYTKALWENVRDKQNNVWKGFCGLCDHPVADNDPGEFKNQAVIWHDMDIGDDGVVYGYCSFVGPYGHLAQEILEHGGRVGTSSSGFGDVDKYSKVVDPNTYIIERLADLVLNPSQGTFGGPESPHSANAFMNDVHQAATIEFGKQKVKESKSEIIRRKQMAEQANISYDAAAAKQQQTAAPQGSAPASTPAQPAGGQQGAAPAQNQQTTGQPAAQPQQKQESKMATNTTLTKIEEKAFRKYVQTFLDDANRLDNPIQRLNECVDILECFEEGNCPDLRTQLEEKLLSERGELEALVEKVVQTEKDYEMDIHSFRAAAERNTQQGMLLKEQVTDFEELCNGLAKRNQQLKEENDRLTKQLRIREKLAEKKIYQSNKEIATTESAVTSLEEKVTALTEKNSRLVERASKLALSNKEFEKENGLLTTKLKEAGQIFKGVKAKDTQTLQEKQAVAAGLKKLQERVAELEQANLELTTNYNVRSDEFKKLNESFAAYKQEVQDTFNPVAHLVPKFEERVGKYLNLRENRGVEVESYWSDLKEKYGETVEPFEQQIRGAKTLKEATSSFLKYRTQIDPDFAVAQPAEYAYRNRAERSALYEHQGIVNPIDSYRDASIDKKNEEFLAGLKAQGLN